VEQGLASVETLVHGVSFTEHPSFLPVSDIGIIGVVEQQRRKVKRVYNLFAQLHLWPWYQAFDQLFVGLLCEQSIRFLIVCRSREDCRKGEDSQKNERVQRCEKAQKS
jgi:hypothetical protein